MSILVYIFSEQPGRGHPAQTSLPMLSLLHTVGSLVYVFLNFTYRHIFMLKLLDLRLVIHGTIIGLFSYLISHERNGTVSPETDSSVSGHLIYDREGTAEQWGTDGHFNKPCWFNWISIRKSMNPDCIQK